MKLKQTIDGSPPYLLALGAMACIVLATVFAWQDKLKAATLLSALFFLCVVLAYFPQLDSIKAFAVDVRLRRSLDRAEELLARLKDLSVISAKTSYMTLAWGNRAGTPLAKDKQAILDQVYEQLNALKVSDDEKREITKPYVQMIAADLYPIFFKVMDRYVQWEETQLRKSSNTADGAAAMRAFTVDVGEWRIPASRGPFYDDYDLEVSLRRGTPDKILDDSNRPNVMKFRSQVLDLYEACKSKGGYTNEAAEFMDAYGAYGYSDPKAIERKVAEVFGVTMAEDA